MLLSVSNPLCDGPVSVAIPHVVQSRHFKRDAPDKNRRCSSGCEETRNLVSTVRPQQQTYQLSGHHGSSTLTRRSLRRGIVGISHHKTSQIPRISRISQISQISHRLVRPVKAATALVPIHPSRTRYTPARFGFNTSATFSLWQ